MFSLFLLLISLKKQYFCQSFFYINEKSLQDQIDYYKGFECVIFGFWSKYNPYILLEFQQTETKETICYNFINALEINTKKSNFLYYDCLDPQQKTIKKIVQFVDEKEEQHNFILDIDTYQYENIWYYFGVSMWIKKNKFEIFIMQNLDTQIYSTLDITFPFYDAHLLIQYGGKLYLNQQQRINTLNQNQLYSSFPGYMYFCKVEGIVDTWNLEKHEFIRYKYLQFKDNLMQTKNIISQFIDQTLKFMDTSTNTTQNKIHDAFSLDGWIKGINILQQDQEFLYKFIKISGNSESEQIMNDNLCPFQLLYRIQNDKFYLQILTYSYNFPSLNLDFLTNPFLIQKEYELELFRIYQWHFLSVRLQEKQLTIQITFSERENQYQLNYYPEVNHFHQMQFKISVGNLFQNKYNYIVMKIFALTLISKISDLEQKQCHLSCKTCDGPTKNNCLSCEQDSLRFYLPESQSCVCPEDHLDQIDGTCKNFENLDFFLVQYKKTLPQCSYGYFKYDEWSCVQCPSNQNSTSIFCLNCLQNPLTWKSNPICETILKYNDRDTLNYEKVDEYDKFDSYRQKMNRYYLYDTQDIKLCIDCELPNLFAVEQIFNDYMQTFSIKENFWNENTQKNADSQSGCNFYGCSRCQLTIEKLKCSDCWSDFIHSDEGYCIPIQYYQFKCSSPYYWNSQSNCILCEIENCQYCFDYLTNDFSKNTLFSGYEDFDIDEFHSTGCALCYEGYQFNFLTGKCNLEESKIQNCLNSFINLQGEEVCTQADSQNFEIAPEIINCQQQIKNCYSCILTIEKIIMCTLCDDGYTPNIFSGQCQLCSIEHSKQCLQGNYLNSQDWVQLVQSFIMLFLDKNYLFSPSVELLTSDSVISCVDGYKPLTNFNQCEKYCNSDCLKCEEILTIPYGFRCVQCPINYYDIPSRSTDYRNCIVCPKLCQICEPRTQDEINYLNPYFMITEDNIQYTHKCIQQIKRKDVYIDPEVQIAKLILKDLDNILNFDVELEQYYDIHLFSSMQNVNYQNQIDHQYFNQIGNDIIQITFKFWSLVGQMLGRSIIQEQTTFTTETMIQNTLKQKIFSLKLIIFNLIGIKEQINIFSDHLITKGFDYINITKINFYLMNPNYFIFYNDQPIYLTVKNCTFQNQDIQTYLEFNINSTYSQFILLNNLTFKNLYVIDSILLNISGEYLKSQIIIQDIIVQDCEFINSTLIFVFQNQQDISIKSIRIINSTFNNSNLLNLNTKNSLSKSGYLTNIQFLNNKFYNCDFNKIFNYQQFTMSNLIISDNQFFNSTLFTINSNFLVDNFIILSNIYVNSLFLTSSDIFQFNIITYIFQDLQLKDNTFLNSQLFLISPSYKQDIYELQVLFKDILIQNNQIDTTLINQQILFKIHCNCNVAKLSNIKILEQVRIKVFYIYDTFSIEIQQFDFTNPFEGIQIPLGQDCFNNFKLLYAIKVFGFDTIILENVYFKNLNVQDQSIIEITSNILFNGDTNEKIYMKNFYFKKMYCQNKIMEKKYQIKFQNNLLHQIADDLSENIAGLIYINSQVSNITITNIDSKFNGITNSSCSFLYLTTYSLYISNYNIDGLNYFNDQLLEKYTSNSEIFNKYTKDEISLVIQKLVSIQTKGSVCFATVTQLEIRNSIFQNIISYTSPLFELKTEGKGLIIFDNLIIRKVDVIYDFNLELQGSIKIYSLNSQLNLFFVNIVFDTVFNKFSSSILTLTPSIRKNQIIFQNVQVLNSLSLLNQIIKAEFSDQNIKSNFVSLQNVSIIQTEQAWFTYFSKIGQIASEDLQKIMNDNALINIVSSTLVVQNLFVQGILQSPIIKIVNALKLHITQCQFLSINTFYQFHLIQISQNKYNSMEIKIYNNEFRNIQLYQPSPQSQIQQLLLDPNQLKLKCKFNNQNLIFSFNTFFLTDTIRLIQSLQSSGSLINLQSLSNQTNVQIQSLKIIENKCDFCSEGLIAIYVQQIQRMKIREFICIQNQIAKQGCLYISSNNDYKNQFTISDSIMALNVGYSGVGIVYNNLKGLIQRTIIFNNSAENDSGGISINSDENNFKLQNVEVFQNQAEQCGGIQISNHSNFQIDNFIKSLALFNKANQLANNIVEAPTQLQLKINNQFMKHNLEIIDNVTFSIIELSTQKIIQQNNIFYTNYLMIPSNQKIIEYKIFDLQALQFVPYITEFSLYFLNSQREQLGNFENQNCSVFQNIMKQNGGLMNQSELFLVSFDTQQSKIDLGNLYFTFDPYEQSQYIQEIQIVCNISENKVLSYKIQTKSFYCQLGEFYTNGGCQICDSKLGFYSVSYNSTKCSIFDRTKFSEITSNSISLLPGFWRFDLLSDSIEFCYQKQNYCLGGWSVGDQSCIQGNLGGLCYECDFYNIRGDGYYFKNLDHDQCSLCDDGNNYVMYFVIVSLIAIISIFMTLRSIEKTNQLFNNLKIGRKFGIIIFKLNQDHESFLIKMFVNYLWIYSLIFTYNINFSINLNIVGQASNTSYSMANNLDCFLAQLQEINLVYIRLVATIFFIFIQFIIVYIIFVLISKIKKQKFDLSNISNTSLYLYISNNAALTKQFCSLIAKKTISNINFVQGNMALKFDSTTHQNWIYAFILPGLSINGCFIPFLLIGILFLKRKQLDQIKVRKYFCYLFNEYNDTNYYWEQIKIWQKTILIIIMVYFEDRYYLKTVLFGLTLIIYQFLANYYKPYIILSLNKLDNQAGLLCCIAIFLAAARNESDSNIVDAGVSRFLQIIIAFLCILLIYLFINILLKAYYKKYKLTALSLLLTITKKLSSQSWISDELQKFILNEQNKRDRLQKNFEKLKQHLIKVYKLNSQLRQEQTCKTDQTFHFFTNKSIKLQNFSQAKE